MRRLFWLFSLAAPGLLLTACGGGSAPEPEPEPETYTVSGSVKDDDGDALEGVTISFDNDADDTTSDSNGKWTSPELSGDVTVTPGHADYTFDPEDRTVSESSGSVNFTGTYDGETEPETYTVSGAIEDEDGHAIEGATISFGTDTDDTTTDSNGKWTSPGLTGDVTVTPNHDDYVFDPEDRIVSGSSGSVDFTGLELFPLSGTVINSEYAPFEDVTIKLTFQDQEVTTTTDADGEWEQDGLYGTVTVTPVKTSYEFRTEFLKESAEHSAAADDVDFLGKMLRCSSGNPVQSSDPCVIHYVEQLQMMQDILDGHFALGDNIDASTTSSWKAGEGFEPIGDEDRPFTGTLDGRGYSIDNLTINRPDDEDIGVFGVLGLGSRVQDLEIIAIAVTGEKRVGGLAGTNQGQISDVRISGSVTASSGPTGGLVGLNNKNQETEFTISNSHSSTDVHGGTWDTGGLVGDHSSTGPIVSSFSSGNVTGEHQTGGLVGSTNSGNIVGSYSTANVEGSGTNVGGLVGHASYSLISHSWSNSNVQSSGDYTGGLVGQNNGGGIEFTYSTSDVSGKDNVGGLVGRQGNTALEPEVHNSYALGTVTGENNVGGLIGDAGIPVRTSFSAAKVTGITNTGGLVGLISSNIDVADSYWDTDTSEQNTSDGGAGKTTPEMHQQNTFEDWDFTDVWQIDEDSDYPDLRENSRQH